MSTTKLETLSVQQRRREGETVYAMLTNRWEVQAECDACKATVRVNLMNLFRLNGPSFSLWGKTTPCVCIVTGRPCAGRMVYKAKPHEAPGFAYLGPLPRVRRRLGRDATGTDRSEWIEADQVDDGPWRAKLGPTPPDPT